MSKPHRKALERLERRQGGYRPAKNAASTRPGSMNRRKAAPVALGRRSRSKIKADSRQATGA